MEYVRQPWVFFLLHLSADCQLVNAIVDTHSCHYEIHVFVHAFSALSIRFPTYNTVLNSFSHVFLWRRKMKNKTNIHQIPHTLISNFFWIVFPIGECTISSRLKTKNQKKNRSEKFKILHRRLEPLSPRRLIYLTWLSL